MWNSGTDQAILAHWRQLRTDICNADTEQKISAVAEFIASIPYGTRTLDYYSPDTWPTPWEILAYRQFCASSISLLAYHTLDMVSTAELALDLIDDGDDVFLVPVVDAAVLNFYPGEAVSIGDLPETTKHLRRYTSADIKPVR